MKIIPKLFKLGLIFIFLLAQSPVCYGAGAAISLFKPCQYKNVYHYYLDKGSAHLAEDQPEAALQAYRMALMVQPISKEARAKIEYIKQLLEQEVAHKEIKARRGVVSKALNGIEKRRRRLFRKPPTRKPIEELEERIVEKPERVKRPKRVVRKAPPEYVREKPAYKRPPHVEERIPEAEKGPPYYDFLNPAVFSDGVDQSIQRGMENINKGIAPSKISGEYRMGVGFTEDDIIWKDANADHVGVPGEKNWRYLFGENMYNTYDKKIYSRLKVETEGHITPHLSGYSEIVIDPWTFVGRKDVTVTGSSGTSVDMTLKYWSNANRTLNETYRADNGDIVNLQERKLTDGDASGETYFGITDWGPATFTLPETEIDHMYVPIRKLWVDYDMGPYHIRLFPMASQKQALTTHDPLRLSNNKVWWEESPWLDEYEPSRIFRKGSGATPVKQGQWVRRLSFVAKNSDYERLTFLRGGTISVKNGNGFSIESTVAAPRSLWDYYDEVSSVPGAVRVELPETWNTKLGSTYTAKAGLFKGDIEALNQVVAVDGEYFFLPDASFYGEGAISFTDIDEASGDDRDYWGGACMFGLKSKGDLESPGDDYELNLSFAHMNDNFLPGLSNYRMTRRDSTHGKHIYFDELKPENEAIKVGNGIDIDRIAANANLKANLLNGNLKARADWRDVRSDSGDFIEDVTRAEVKCKVIPKITVIGMGRYKRLPKTEKGIDPLINAKTSYIAFTDYFSDKDVWLENSDVEEDKDPSVETYSAGLKYDVMENLSLQAIYEITNDPLDMPRGLLNNVYQTDETRDGILWDKIVPLLYNQDAFDQPPYDYYNIYKGRLTFYPIKALKIEPSYVYNENEFATTLDDNVNHAGVIVEFSPSNKLTLGAAYYYIQIRDLWRDTIGGEGENFDEHHNVFVAADYEINPNQSLTAMFGEYTGYGREYYEDYTSIGPLDTQHIVRLTYKGKF